jgi:hypothetical protein
MSSIAAALIAVGLFAAVLTVFSIVGKQAH